MSSRLLPSQSLSSFGLIVDADNRATSSPSCMSRKVGSAWTPRRMQTRRALGASSLTTFRSSCASASFSTWGMSARHGRHSGPHTSTRTVPLVASSSKFSRVASLTAPISSSSCRLVGLEHHAHAVGLLGHPSQEKTALGNELYPLSASIDQPGAGVRDVTQRRGDMSLRRGETGHAPPLDECADVLPGQLPPAHAQRGDRLVVALGDVA